MPFVTQAYLNYLEQQMGAGGGGVGGVDLPPITPEEPTTAPFGPPSQGGAGSYPEPPQEPSTVASGATPQTPPQWPPGGYGTGYVPAPNVPLVPPPEVTAPPPEGAAPPYVYNDPYGTGDPSNINIPYPGETPVPTQEGPPDQGLPAPPGATPPVGPASPPWSAPTNYANIPSMLGNLFRNIAEFFPQGPGGFGQPMGYFPPGTAGPGPLPQNFFNTIPNYAGPLPPGYYAGQVPLPGAFGNYGLGGGGPIMGGPSSMAGGRTGQGIYGAMLGSGGGAGGSNKVAPTGAV